AFSMPPVRTPPTSSRTTWPSTATFSLASSTQTEAPAPASEPPRAPHVPLLFRRGDLFRSRRHARLDRRAPLAPRRQGVARGAAPSRTASGRDLQHGRSEPRAAEAVAARGFRLVA